MLKEEEAEDGCLLVQFLCGSNCAHDTYCFSSRALVKKVPRVDSVGDLLGREERVSEEYGRLYLH